MKSATPPFSDSVRRRIRLNVAVMTISDSRSTHTDTSGDYLVQALSQADHQLATRALVPSQRWAIRKVLCDWIVDDNIDVIITNGGTGYGPDKATVAAVAPMLDETITGFGELFRQLSYHDVGSSSIQSDATAGMANNTVIFCLPGSTGACRLAWDEIIQPQLDSQKKPCNFATTLRP
ncbi:MAG TPA: molybdenum cofactor synthesis domain-containing protein [Burkholderiaceae bacterium]|nr:molybdenum cofactor synthesis domain-containing protein [Burkholderiaceae bacterium]